MADRIQRVPLDHNVVQAQDLDAAHRRDRGAAVELEPHRLTARWRWRWQAVAPEALQEPLASARSARRGRDHEGLLDEALWRRFDDVLVFPRPTVAQLTELLAMRLRGVRKTGVDLGALANDMQGFTFADAERVCIEATKAMILSGAKELRGICYGSTSAMHWDGRRRRSLRKLRLLVQPLDLEPEAGLLLGREEVAQLEDRTCAEVSKLRIARGPRSSAIEQAIAARSGSDSLQFAAVLAGSRNDAVYRGTR